VLLAHVKKRSRNDNDTQIRKSTFIHVVTFTVDFNRVRTRMPT
jgi:hypothetical protein